MKLNGNKIFLMFLVIFLIFNSSFFVPKYFFEDEKNVFFSNSSEIKAETSLRDSGTYYFKDNTYIYVYPLKLNNKTYLPQKSWMALNDNGVAWPGMTYSGDSKIIYLQERNKNPESLFIQTKYVNKDDSSDNFLTTDYYKFTDKEYPYSYKTISYLFIISLISIPTFLALLYLISIGLVLNKEKINTSKSAISILLAYLNISILFYLGLGLSKTNLIVVGKLWLILLLLFAYSIISLILPLIYYKNKEMLDKKFDKQTYIISSSIYLFISLSLFSTEYSTLIIFLLMVMIILFINYVFEKNHDNKIKFLKYLSSNKLLILYVLGFLLFWQFVTPIFSPKINSISEELPYYFYHESDKIILKKINVELDITPALFPISFGIFTTNKITFNYDKQPTVVIEDGINSIANGIFFKRVPQVIHNEITLYFKDDIKSEKLKLKFHYYDREPFFSSWAPNYPLDIKKTINENNTYYLLTNLVKVPITDYVLRINPSKIDSCNCIYEKNSLVFNESSYYDEDGTYCKIGVLMPEELLNVKVIC